MLVVTVDIVMGGIGPLRWTIGSMRISNRSNLADVSDYHVESMEAANPLTGAPCRSAEAVVRAHRRKQSAWALLQRACEEIIKAEFTEL
jgi:hypothetical protein